MSRTFDTELSIANRSYLSSNIHFSKTYNTLNSNNRSIKRGKPNNRFQSSNSVVYNSCKPYHTLHRRLSKGKRSSTECNFTQWHYFYTQFRKCIRVSQWRRLYTPCLPCTQCNSYYFPRTARINSSRADTKRPARNSYFCRPCNY